MGTDWKKSKLAARILCGWLGMMSLLAALLCLLACGPAMLGGSSVGMGDLLAGQLSGSVYYQEKMAELFYNCSLLAAGGAAGDGTPLTAGQNTQLRSQARDALNNDSGALSSGQVLFAVLPDSESGVSYSNTDFALWEDGRVAAPLGYSVALASTGGSSWGNRALLAAYTRLLTSQTVHPSAEGLENAVVVLAVQDGAGPWLPGFVGEGLRQVETLRPHLILFLSGCTLALGCGVVCLGWRRRALPARAWAASLTGRIWLEVKLLIWVVGLFCLWVWQAVYVPDALWTVLPALLWPLVWLTAVDLRFNGAGVFRCSLLARLAGLARGSWRAQPWQRRVAGPAVLCWLAPVVMVPMLWLMFFTCYWAAPGLVLFALVLGHLAALAILLVCLLAIRVINRIVQRFLRRTHLDPRMTKYLLAFVKVLLYILTVLMVAQSLGIPTTSLVALFSVLSLAVSLAVQDVLGNVAGGLVILFSKPFQIGDYIEVDQGDVAGTVAEIDLIHTKLDTADGQRVLMPNRTMADSKITNFTQLGTRRIDLAIGASYDDPIPAVRAACLEAVSMTPDILPDPAPAVVVTNYGESAIEYHVRCWSRVETYWDANYALLENIKACFDRRGVTMTYNHLNIHILDNDLEKKDHGTL